MLKKVKNKLDWELRISHRARYARLQIKPYGGLEVIIPPRFPRREIPALVEQHAGWIRQQLAEQTRLRESIRLPQTLDLAFDNSSIQIVYADQFQYDLFAQPPVNRLMIEVQDERERIQVLRNWIRDKAWACFPARLEKLSQQTGLSYRGLSIRSQKTRWGSCSGRGKISLNDQLLFVPETTVEYLMIHELCHTRHLNHSRKFWDLVVRHCPDYHQHEKILGQPRSLVPDWFLADLYA